MEWSTSAVITSRVKIKDFAPVFKLERSDVFWTALAIVSLQCLFRVYSLLSTMMNQSYSC